MSLIRLSIVLAAPLIAGASCSKIFSDEGKYFYCQVSAEKLEFEEITITMKDVEAKNIKFVCEESASEQSTEQEASVTAP